MAPYSEDIPRTLYPIHLDPVSLTMDKKLIINVAPSGMFIKRQQNPNQPYSEDDVVKSVVESYKAGAAVWHMHPFRDQDGIVTDRSAQTFVRAIDRVLDECPGMILSHSSHSGGTTEGADAVRPRCGPLLEASAKYGRKYIETVVVAPARISQQPMNEGSLKEMVGYLQDNGIKPEFQNFNYNCIYHVNNWLIGSGILKKPYVMNLISGYHGYDFFGPTLPETLGYTYLINMMQALPQGCVVGATIGGHHWLPFTIFSIMLGVDCVRIGMEDTMWMYPHKDEKIKAPADVVKKVATIARELGREIATPQEAREILGLMS